MHCHWNLLHDILRLKLASQCILIETGFMIHCDWNWPYGTLSQQFPSLCILSETGFTVHCDWNWLHDALWFELASQCIVIETGFTMHSDINRLHNTLRLKPFSLSCLQFAFSMKQWQELSFFWCGISTLFSLLFSYSGPGLRFFFLM